ncbi:MAG: GNAT family N-acetyltransferase [Alphaproteobacteria bacterium]
MADAESEATAAKGVDRCRGARPADIPAILELGARFHGESRFRCLPFDRTVLRARLEQALARPDRYFVAVAEDASGLIGVLAGYLTTFYFCASPVAMDACFYVRSDRRGGPSAKHLLAQFESWARQHGVPHLLLGITSGVADDRAEGFYRHLGFDTMGVVMGKEL